MLVTVFDQMKLIPPKGVFDVYHTELVFLVPVCELSGEEGPNKNS